MEKEIFSQKYLDWVKTTNQSGLTNSQHKFAEWLLQNSEMLTMIGGNYEEIFASIRKYLRK